jgi:transcriptional regulator with XRE-family HTH domain
MEMAKARILEVFSERLRAARQRREMTQAAVAHAAGLHAIYVARLEAGQQNPSLEVLVRLALALEVPIEELVPIPSRRTTTARVLRRPASRRATR